MFSEIISQIGVTWRPPNVKLLLFYSVFDPVEPHIHSFGSFLLDGVVDNATRGGVVSGEVSGVLVVTHLRKCCACDGALFGVDKERYEFSFSDRRDHMFEDCCLAQDRAIGEGFHAFLVAQIEIPTNSGFGFWLGEERGITVDFKLHAGGIVPYADITPSSQPDRALSALTYGLKHSCNLSQSHYGRTPIACTHTTGNSNAHLSKISYRNLLTTQYKQGCNQCEYFHTQVYQKLNTHQLHLNAPYKHLSASVPTSPVERNN
jgi:hypothetical protein